MFADPEVRIAGKLRESLEELRAVTDDRELCELMDAGQEHASFHTLLDTGVRGLRRYLTDSDAHIELRGADGLPPEGAEAELSRGGATRPGGPDGSAADVDTSLELAERSLAVIDAALSSAADCPVYESSLAVQEGITHFRGRIHAAVANLNNGDPRRYLEKLAESLCRELSLRHSPLPDQ